MIDHSGEVVTFASKPPIGQDPTRRSAAATKLKPRAICVFDVQKQKVEMRY